MSEFYEWMNDGHRRYTFFKDGKRHTLEVKNNGYFDEDYLVKIKDLHYTPTSNELLEIIEKHSIRPKYKKNEVIICYVAFVTNQQISIICLTTNLLCAIAV